MNGKAAVMSMAHTTSYTRFSRDLLSRLAALFTRRRRKRLDPRILSDHLQRDIGFSDGRATAGRVQWHMEDEFCP